MLLQFVVKWGLLACLQRRILWKKPKDMMPWKGIYIALNSNFVIHSIICTARCYAERGDAAVRLLSVCPSVCPSLSLSETFRYVFHTGWNTSKIISRPNSLRYVLKLTWRSGPTGTPSKIGFNRGGVLSTKNLQYLWNSARYDQSYCNRLIESRIRAFDWYQNQWPWMTLNSRNVTLAEIKSFAKPTEKNLNEDRPILSAAKCRLMVIVSRNVGIYGYSRGFLGEGTSNIINVIPTSKLGYSLTMVATGHLLPATR